MIIPSYDVMSGNIHEVGIVIDLLLSGIKGSTPGFASTIAL